MKLKTIILCGLAIAITAALAITAVGGFFGWFGPRTLIVDDNGKADYDVIQLAINAARDGDTVFVKNGIYPEKLIINKSIKLVGEDRNSTFIDSGGKDICVYVNADNIFVRNFTVKP